MLGFLTQAAVRPQLIFVPCCGMAFLTFSQLLRLVTLRIRATQTRRISPKYYKLYNTEGGEPADIALVSQHVENLFEAPPLFYIAATILYVTRSVGPASVALAWAYLAFRILHTVIHTGSNNILARMLAYVGSTVALAGLWGLVGVAALQE